MSTQRILFTWSFLCLLSCVTSTRAQVPEPNTNAPAARTAPAEKPTQAAPKAVAPRKAAPAASTPATSAATAPEVTPAPVAEPVVPAPAPPPPPPVQAPPPAPRAPAELRPPPAPPAPSPRSAYVPYGATANPALSGEERKAILEELFTVERRLEGLKVQRDQYPITGPVVMVATGFGGALLFGLAAVGAWATGEEIDRGIRTGDEDYVDRTHSDANHARRAGRIVGGLSAAPLALGIVGAVFLKRRLEERRKYNPEIGELQQRRKELQRQMHYGVRLGQNGAGLSLTATF